MMGNPRSLAIALGAKKRLSKGSDNEKLHPEHEPSIPVNSHMAIVHGLMAKKMAQGGSAGSSAGGSTPDLRAPSMDSGNVNKQVGSSFDDTLKTMNAPKFAKGGMMDGAEKAADPNRDFMEVPKYYDGDEVEGWQKSPFHGIDDDFLSDEEQTPLREHDHMPDPRDEDDKASKKDILSKIMMKMHQRHMGK